MTPHPALPALDARRRGNRVVSKYKYSMRPRIVARNSGPAPGPHRALATSQARRRVRCGGGASGLDRTIACAEMRAACLAEAPRQYNMALAVRMSAGRVGCPSAAPRLQRDRRPRFARAVSEVRGDDARRGVCVCVCVCARARTSRRACVRDARAGSSSPQGPRATAPQTSYASFIRVNLACFSAVMVSPRCRSLSG